MQPVESTNHAPLTAPDLTRLAGRKIFFGHQSVDDDIVRGLRDLMASEPRLKLRIVQSAEPQLVPRPAFVEAHIRRNGESLRRDAQSEFIDNGQQAIALAPEFTTKRRPSERNGAANCCRTLALRTGEVVSQSMNGMKEGCNK